MLKKDIRIGGLYLAKVSDMVQPVKITAEHPRGGWIAVNPRTNRVIRIKTAQRLRREIEHGTPQ